MKGIHHLDYDSFEEMKEFIDKHFSENHSRIQSISVSLDSLDREIYHLFYWD